MALPGGMLFLNGGSFLCFGTSPSLPPASFFPSSGWKIPQRQCLVECGSWCQGSSCLLQLCAAGEKVFKPILGEGRGCFLPPPLPLGLDRPLSSGSELG